MSDSPGKLTLTAYAARRGVSKMAVSKAVKSGRLIRSVGRTEGGRPVILDADLADQEWAANTDLTDAPASVIEASRNWPGSEREDDEVSPRNGEDWDLADASRHEKKWKAKLAELKFKEAAAELVPAKDVARKMADTFTTCKVKLLAIPSRAKTQDPDLTLTQVALLEALVREALEELGGGE